MFSFGLFGDETAFDPLLLLLAALVLDAVWSGVAPILRFLPDPVERFAWLVGSLEGKLNREKRSAMDRAVRGFFLVMILLAGVAAAAIGVAWLSRNHDFGWPVEWLLIAALLDQRTLYFRVRAVASALGGGNLDAARESVRPLVGRDPSLMDAHGLARVAIEAAARGLSAGVIAPAFWYILFGFPGFAVCRALSVMDAAIGHTTPRYRAFGLTAARLDDIVQFVPARLTALLLVVAAVFAPGGRPASALRTLLRDGRKHRSFNAGWPVAAMAGGLDLALAGPRRYAERVADDAWIGVGTARAEGIHIRRALYLFAVVCLFNLMTVAALALFWLGG